MDLGMMSKSKFLIKVSKGLDAIMLWALLKMLELLLSLNCSTMKLGQ